MFAGMDDLDTITSEDRDAIFARVYVEQRALKKGNAAEIACVRAGITSPELNMSIVASRQLARPEVQRLVMAAEASGYEVERREYTRDLFWMSCRLWFRRRWTRARIRVRLVR